MRAVLIPAKNLELAKHRLAPAIDPSARRALAEAMFRDVLEAATAPGAPWRVAVVSSDGLLLDLARRAGALAIDEGAPHGLNPAVAMATAELAREGVTSLCVALSDTPLVTATDIEAAFAGLNEARGVVLVPSRDFSGTNMIARAPAGVIATRLGAMSLGHHLEDCRAADLPCRVIPMARPALDLDLLSDLMEYARVASYGHTRIVLAGLGMARL